MRQVPEVAVPGEWARQLHRYPADGGPSGADWVRRLPGLLKAVLTDWALTPTGQPSTGRTAIVVPVSRPDSGPLALKAMWPHRESAGEHLALRRWAGDGAVRLVAADPGRGVLLLEGLDADRDLADVDIDLACQVIGGLLQRLHVPALPQLPRLSDFVSGEFDTVAAHLGTVPRRYLDQAAALVRILRSDPACDLTLIHTDLHYRHVLAADREPWLAIDPRPMAGHPGFEVHPVLHNRPEEYGSGSSIRRGIRRRLEMVCDAADIEVQAAKSWTIVAALLDAHFCATHHDEDGATLSIAIIKALSE